MIPYLSGLSRQRQSPIVPCQCQRLPDALSDECSSNTRSMLAPNECSDLTLAPALPAYTQSSPLSVTIDCGRVRPACQPRTNARLTSRLGSPYTRGLCDRHIHAYSTRRPRLYLRCRAMAPAPEGGGRWPSVEGQARRCERLVDDRPFGRVLLGIR